MAGSFEVDADASSRLRMDGERVILPTFPDEVQRWVPGIHVKVFNLQAGDFRPPRANL